MLLEADAIDEFRRIYEEECGEPISVEDARALAGRVLHLYRVLARSLPGERRASPLEGLDAFDRMKHDG
jgi:hypothetical protein